MKHIPTFESFSDETNESFRLDPKGGETLLNKMTVINPNKSKWEMNIVDLDDDGDEYIILTGEYAKSITGGNSVWIPKTQWDEFKRLINSI
jgi:hypothetical protein